MKRPKLHYLILKQPKFIKMSELNLTSFDLGQLKGMKYYDVANKIEDG